jgi:hypothetical protein
LHSDSLRCQLSYGVDGQLRFNSVSEWCLMMEWKKIHEKCPCRKGEFCTNCLACEERYCFLHNVRWLKEPCLTWADSKNVQDYLALAICGIASFS